ncbi:NAD-dependent formate dehydrogenase flavoprotein subunit [Murinocardiopsis flavida]|uniref:NAD-dependent formate dehydrogenase flavoprotein subunit n=1 Tax=Murinocardiopsis flavida TaxID=645275 RepID=A0A2P8DKJ6_9ACTN|nr:NADH-ubiquinone oxidoreductase-F iron-sulfur binding region domain-containing protein [Murinocardiopsis flavida]PSK97733.1 NAD-dependent formate dehydrogenase flavoprotein subunit [Murinocardiopsis flavida]
MTVEAQQPKVPGVEARAGKFRGPSLIPMLIAIQERRGWLPREELTALAREQRRPLYEIEGLVSFYPHFRTEEPKGATVGLCHDLACWLKGSESRIGAMRERYGDAEDVAVTEISCPGRCDIAPAATVDDAPCRIDDVPAVLAAGSGGHADPGATVAYGPAEGWPNDPYDRPEHRYGALRALLTGAVAPEQVIADLQEAGLRGMGGAGFPTGRKWDLVRKAPGGVKYAICNADESEPGTFKDRQLLAEQPHLVLEGMLMGMVVTGAEEGWVFIRHEYGPEEAVLRAEIERLGALGLTGDDVLGTGRRLVVDVFTSPGGYILGEETALIECMEGHRGEPRNKPPFPGVHGLWGRPTLMNSVETFADVPVIATRGAQWWLDQGIGESGGLKFFSVSGHVERPGVYCVPMGTTIRALVDLAGGVAGGAELDCVQPGGASSNFLDASHLDTPLDFGTLAEAGSMLGSGALVVIAKGTDTLAAATNVLRFFRNESCGKCVPCRVGSTKAHDLLAETLRSGGELSAERRERLLELETVMRKTSICGLGQVAMGPVVSVLNGSGAAGRPE